MPTEFQKIFTIEIPIHVRKLKSGGYEARYRANGLNLSVSSTDYEKLKAKFYQLLLNYKPTLQPIEHKTKTQCPETKLEEKELFITVAERWLELKKPTIKSPTYNYYVSMFRANLRPFFKGVKIDEIKQSNVQEFINQFIKEQKNRTANKLFLTLKSIFDFALGEELIERSPMSRMQPPKYEEKKGTAFTLNEEREFLTKLKESKCAEEISAALIFLLYTGLRRSELSSIQIKDKFVVVQCSKIRKGYHEKTRLVPITPMLENVLPYINIEKIKKVKPNALTQAVKRLMPNHHLHELRHTFITRCQECGVPREVVSVWAGHAPDNTMTSNVYTHFSPEFMQKEGQKVRY